MEESVAQEMIFPGCCNNRYTSGMSAEAVSKLCEMVVVAILLSWDLMTYILKSEIVDE